MNCSNSSSTQTLITRVIDRDTVISYVFSVAVAYFLSGGLVSPGSYSFAQTMRSAAYCPELRDCLDLHDIHSLRPFCSLHNVEVDMIPVSQRSIAG